MISPRVSVVVPIYNSESALQECLDSLSAQTLNDIEIILVDDGSTDDSLEIANSFAFSYKGLCTVLSQQNAGPSAARNKGLDVARGEFIAFVDSDDVVHPTMYEKLVESADKYGSDIISCGRVSVDSSTGKIIKEKVPKYDVLEGCVRTNPSIAKRVSPLMCDKMFRRSIIEEWGLRLDDDIRHAEDYLFSSRYRLYTKSVSAVGEVLYRYKVSNQASLSGGNAYVMDIPEACRRIVKLYQEEGVLRQTSEELMFVFTGYYLRKCKALPPRSPQLKEFKKSFKSLFLGTFGSKWLIMATKRAIRDNGIVKGALLLAKALT